MPVYFVLGLAAVVFYFWLCYQAIVHVVIPVLGWVVLLGAAGGVLLVVVVLAAGLFGASFAAAPLVTPQQARTRLPSVRSAHGRDGAYAHYLFAQVVDDLRATVVPTWKLAGQAWTKCFEGLREAPIVLAAWPLLLLPGIALVTGTASAAVATVVVYGVLALVLGVSVLLFAVLAGVLRGTDLGVRRLRRAKATCHHAGCNHTSELPGYRCPGCRAVHHDIRAGRQGLFARRCECGRLLPTTVLKAASGLVAVCQMCDRELHAGSAVTTDIVVPVFGPASAGKTRLVMAGMVALERHLGALQGTLTPVGAESGTILDDARTLVRDGAPTTKTPAGAPPAAITVEVAAGRRRARVHLFDAAGESFGNRDLTGDLRFLDDVQGLVLVVDPFSVPEVAGALDPATLAAAAPAREGPEDAYRLTTQSLRDQGAVTGRIPVAVAVVKADLLLGLPPAAGLTADSDSAGIREWLLTKDMGNLVTQIGRDFGSAEYHLVSSWDSGASADGRAGPLSPAGPLLRLLGRCGVAVAEPARAATP